jgi:hypothetical protein
MHKTVLFVVFACALLSGCDHRVEDIGNCIAGKIAGTTQPAMDVGRALSVLKAAGFVVSRPDDAAATSVPAQVQVPAPAQTAPAAQTAAPAHTAAQRQFSLLCHASVEGQRVSQNLSVNLDADTVNGARADVSDTEIKWTTQSRDNPGAAFSGQMHTLNRLNGDYRFYDEGAMYAAATPTYQCALASARLF